MQCPFCSDFFQCLRRDLVNSALAHYTCSPTCAYAAEMKKRYGDEYFCEECGILSSDKLGFENCDPKLEDLEQDEETAVWTSEDSGGVPVAFECTCSESILERFGV
jgi:hypothetical protein